MRVVMHGLFLMATLIKRNEATGGLAIIDNTLALWVSHLLRWAAGCEDLQRRVAAQRVADAQQPVRARGVQQLAAVGVQHLQGVLNSIYF